MPHFSTTPERDSATPLLQSLEQLQNDQKRQESQPVITLSLSLQQMGVLSAAALDALYEEDPSLLRGRSDELVNRTYVSEEDLHHALARVAACAEVDVLHFVVAPHAFDVLPIRIASAHEVVPLGQLDDRFVVASWAPTSEDLHKTLCNLTGHSISLVWAARATIVKRLELQERTALLPSMQFPQRTHGHAEKSISVLADDHSPQDIESLMSLALIEIATDPEHERAESSSDSSGMVRMVKKMIEDALARGASDIHIETNHDEQNTLIRFRIDGELTVYLALSSKLRAALISRIKVMAHLDISEHRRPQDGKIDFSEFGAIKLELRVVVMPTHDGLEDVVMRLLASSKPIPLGRLGLQPRDAKIFTRMSSHSFGLILAAGPTGSGKTTTLHSMLAELNKGERKIWTAEDPIEISHPGLRQVQVNPKIGFTFATAMRSFLRADPDIIMIGEIRDQETAKIVVEASLTGHLVLSTLHTNSASESVVRLLDLGMDAMNFADSLIGVIAQRLVRALCSHCAEPHQLTERHFDQLVGEYIENSVLSAQQGQQRLLEAAGVDSPDKIVVHQAKGCDRCGGKGYKGRMGVYEILENNQDLRLLIQQSARPGELFDAAVAAGMRSLRHDALEKMVQGKLDAPQAKAAYI